MPDTAPLPPDHHDLYACNTKVYLRPPHQTESNREEVVLVTGDRREITAAVVCPVSSAEDADRIAILLCDVLTKLLGNLEDPSDEVMNDTQMAELEKEDAPSDPSDPAFTFDDATLDHEAEPVVSPPASLIATLASFEKHESIPSILYAHEGAKADNARVSLSHPILGTLHLCDVPPQPAGKETQIRIAEWFVTGLQYHFGRIKESRADGLPIENGFSGDA